MHETGRVLVYQAEDGDNLAIADKPLISVIIPTHNRKEILKMALESVMKQTYPNYEVIVIDDASIDGTSDWISTHYPDIGFIRLDKQGGPAKARNEGIKAARGELIAFLDSDDIWLPEYLQLQVSALAHNPASIMSFTECLEVNTDNIQRKVGYRHNPDYPSLIHRLLFETSFIRTMSMVVVRADKLRKAGPLNERLFIGHDRELYIRLLQSGGDIVFIPRALVIKYIHSDNLCQDLCLWADNSLLLLDIFFSNAENKQYKELEGMAKGKACVILLKHSLFSQLKPWARLRSLAKTSFNVVRFWKYAKGHLRQFIAELFRLFIGRLKNRSW